LRVTIAKWFTPKNRGINGTGITPDITVERSPEDFENGDDPQLEKAIEGLGFADRPDAFKNAHYLLGRLYQAAGKNEQAEHHYGEVLAVDYEYKDVLKRMEELAGSGGSALEE
ncbi:MAG: hypothetical protein ACK48R_09705, partial [Planctomyces sp.]